MPQHWFHCTTEQIKLFIINQTNITIWISIPPLNLRMSLVYLTVRWHHEQNNYYRYQFNDRKALLILHTVQFCITTSVWCMWNYFTFCLKDCRPCTIIKTSLYLRYSVIDRLSDDTSKDSSSKRLHTTHTHTHISCKTVFPLILI